jgi:hypothetical protein
MKKLEIQINSSQLDDIYSEYFLLFAINYILNRYFQKVNFKNYISKSIKIQQYYRPKYNVTNFFSKMEALHEKAFSVSCQTRPLSEFFCKLKQLCSMREVH